MNATSAVAIKPSPDRLRHPVLRYMVAVHPPVLAITLAAWVLGFAVAWYSGVSFNGWAAAAPYLLVSAPLLVLEQRP